MSDFSLIQCCEEHNSRSEKITDEGASCTVTLRCAWTDRILLANDIAGLRRPWPSFSSWVRPPRARSVSIVGDGGAGGADGQEHTYEEALVTVEYDNNVEETEDDEDSPELVINESLEPMVEYMTLDYRKFRWTNAVGDPLTEAEAPGRPMYFCGLVRNVVKWQNPPIDILDKINCTNVATYNSARLGLSFAPGTLLYIPQPMNRAVTTQGAEAFNVTLKFGYKPETWNEFWRASKNAYAKIWSIDDAAEYIQFPEEDLSPLLF